MKFLMVIFMVFGIIVSASSAGENDGKKPQYVISVTQAGKSLGEIVIELFPDLAPKHCANFDSLVAAKFYDGTAFHRVIPGFMIQGGSFFSKTPDVAKWGISDPSQKKIPAEFSKTPHVRGIISAARTNDPNSATSQFFICVDEASSLDEQYSVYGHVISGMEVADVIVNSPRNGRDMPDQKIEMTIRKK